MTGAKKSHKETAPLFEPGHATVRRYRDNIRAADASLNKITRANTTMNRELIKELGMQYGMQMFDPHATPTASHMDVAIVGALANYYDVLREGGKKRARSNFNRIVLDNLHNILALATREGASQRGMAIRMKQEGSGCRTLIKLGIERMALYEKTNLKKNLIKFRRDVRSDRLRAEWGLQLRSSLARKPQNVGFRRFFELTRRYTYQKKENRNSDTNPLCDSLRQLVAKNGGKKTTAFANDSKRNSGRSIESFVA